MKKIMIYAYTKYNLGDDLFIKILVERYPNTEFILHAPQEYREVFSKVRNLKVIPNNTKLVRGINFLSKTIKPNFIREFVGNKSDGFVYIGGSLFIQRENWLRAYENKKRLHIKNKPFYLLGANFGPYQDSKFYNKYKEVFREYTDICFREKYSYDLFKDLNNVRLAPDVVFQLKPVSYQTKAETKNVVISVIKPSIRRELEKYDASYYKKIKEITMTFVDRGYKVCLMSFCQGEGDELAINEIKELLPTRYLDDVSSYYYRKDINEALKILELSSLVVATRFHSMILAWLFKKPVYPIIYSNKMTNVIQDVGFEGKYTNIWDVHNLVVEEVVESLENNTLDISKQVQDSEKHFQELDEFLIVDSKEK